MRSTFTFARMAAVLVCSAVIAAGCGDSDSQAMPELDLATLEGDTEFETVEAQRAENSFRTRAPGPRSPWAATPAAPAAPPA